MARSSNTRCVEDLRCLLESDAGLKLPLGLVCKAETQGHGVVPRARGVCCGLGGPRPSRAGDWHPDDCAGHGGAMASRVTGKCMATRRKAREVRRRSAKPRCDKQFFPSPNTRGLPVKDINMPRGDLGMWLIVGKCMACLGSSCLYPAAMVN